MGAKLGSKKRVTANLSTGQAALLLRCSQQTVIRCFDEGQLKGFRVPGSKFRRIPRENVLAFAEAHGIPVDRTDPLWGPLAQQAPGPEDAPPPAAA